jgi:hypothetical protein
MRTYLLVTAIAFALLALMHVWSFWQLGTPKLLTATEQVRAVSN